jgi:hypothetical protein
MNYLYRVKRLPATDSKPTRLKVTRALTNRSHIVPIDHSAINPAIAAVIDAFGAGFDTANLEFCGADELTTFYISTGA